jgi:hypothetical protein
MKSPASSQLHKASNMVSVYVAAQATVIKAQPRILDSVQKPSRISASRHQAVAEFG